MIRRSVRAQGALVILLGFAATLAACGGQAESAAPAREAASSTTTQPVGVKNDLQNWWGGQGVDVTWSATVSGQFSGDNYPGSQSPNGFAGVQQSSPSSVYRVALKPAVQDGAKTIFTLTPTMTVDGSQIAMQPIRVGFAADFYQRDGDPETQGMSKVQWRMIDGAGALLSCDSAISTSLDTPKGRIWYRVVAQCSQSSYQ